MNDPTVSIILRSYNEGWALGKTLAAVASQNYRNHELIVFDSGSIDGSVDLIRHANPAHFVQLRPSDYNPSRVMNQAICLAKSNYCIFLNADATPCNDNWLRPLAAALLDPKVGAVFGRQIPRPDCRAVYACDYHRCFGPDRESAQWDHFFSMVSSGVRKDIWSKRGFLEKLQYAEDHEYTLWCKSAGYKVVYCLQSVVMHSHNYTPKEAYKRSFGDARALAASFNGNRAQFNFLRCVALGWMADFRRDLVYCIENKRLEDLPHAARIRFYQRRGKRDGFRQGWKDYRLK